MDNQEIKQKGIMHDFRSLFSDGEWDIDSTKIFGFIVIIAGLVGFFIGKSDFQWVIAFGSGLISTGKFSKQG